MARLNKKVAILGLVILTAILLAGAGFWWKNRKDPAEYINKAETALVRAKTLIKDYEAKGDYSEKAVEAVNDVLDEVKRNYSTALSCTKGSKNRVNLIFTMADVYAMNNKFHSADWEKIRGCWAGIITINPKNIDARLKQLNYFYDQQLSFLDIVPSGDPTLWVEIKKQASELIDVMKEQNLPVSAHVLKARARATLGMADVEKNPEEYIDEAIKEFTKLLEIAPDDVEIYELLGQAYMNQGEKRKISSGSRAMEKAMEKRDEIIKLGVDNAKDKAKANVNLLNLRFSKTLNAVSPLAMRLDQCLRDMKSLKYIEKTLAASNNNNTQQLQNGLKDYTESVAKDKKLIQDELVSLSAAYSLSPDVKEKFLNLLEIPDIEAFRAEGKNFIKLIEAQIFQPFKDDFVSLSQQYPSSADIHAAFSRALTISESSNFDGAIDEISKAIDLDKQNIVYVYTKAELLYRKAMVEHNADTIEEGIKLAGNALEFPDISVDSGPKGFSAKSFRVTLYKYLARCHIERALIAQAKEDVAQSERSISNAEDAIHQIKQFAKADEFVKRKWDGLLAMAKGDKVTSISNLYYAQKLLKTTENVDTLVSYYLSKQLNGRADAGSRLEFLTDALMNKFDNSNFVSIAGTRPEALLDYAELLLQMNQYSIARDDVAMVYEEKYGRSDRSSSVIIISDIASMNFEEAEKRLSTMDPESKHTIELQLRLVSTRISYINLQLSALNEGVDNPDAGNAETLKKELKELKAQLYQLAIKRIKTGSDDFSFPSQICVQLLNDGEIEKANEVADLYIAATKNNTEALFYKAILSQPDPLHVPAEKQVEIREQILKKIDDELQRHIMLGSFYFSREEYDKSLSEYKSALKFAPDNIDAIGGFFDSSLRLNDINSATSILESVKKNNIDYCDGEFFTARIDIANKEYDSAIKRIDYCLTKRPIFSYAHMLKSSIYAAKRDYEEAVTSAKSAARINSLDGNVAKQVVVAIETRNTALGNKVTDTQREEMTKALKAAISLNQDEWQIQSMYARHVYQTDPESAISVMQRIAQRFPKIENYLLLGKFASDLGARKINKAEKKFYFDIAEPAFEKAYQLSPQDNAVVDPYCDFLRLSGKHDQAVKILEGRSELLWVFHLRDGQFEKAKEILVKLYEKSPKDIQILRGLMKACKETSDKDGVVKYSQELLSVENSVDNQLLQIQMYLDSGLVSEASDLLSSFRTRHPDERRGLLLEAWSTMSKGKLDIAKKLADKYLAVDPDNAIAWRLRGQIHSIGGDYEKAINDMNKSRKIDDNSTIQIELARVFSKCGKMTDAIGVLSPALNDDRAPLRMLEMLEQLYTQSGRKSDLPGFYRKTLEKYPESVNWHFRAGRFSLVEGKYTDAQKYFYTALKLSGNTKNTYVILDGYLSAMRGASEYQKAIDFAKKYITTEYAPIAYLNMANAHDKLDERKKSLECFYKAIETSGDNSFYILKILSNMSNVIGSEEVVKWCKNELSKDTSSFVANRMMSMIMLDKKQFSEAIDYADNCLKGFEPDTDKYLEMLAIKANIAVAAYMKTGGDNFLKIAIESNTYILSKNPRNSGILNNLSYFYAKTGTNIDKAVEYGKMAHKINPNDSNVMDTYAFALVKSGEYKQAKELLLSAIGIIEKDSIELPWDLVNHLAMAQEGLSEKQEARESYLKALKLAGDEISTKDKEELIASAARVSN